MTGRIDKARWLVPMLVIGSLAATISNSPKVYSNIKNHWQLGKQWSVKEVSNVWMVGGLGLFLIPAGMVYDKYGTFGIMVYGVIINTSGFFLNAFALKLELPAVVYGVFTMLQIHGGSALNFGAIWTNSKSWPKEQSGLVSGVLLACYSLGALLITQIWKILYAADGESIMSNERAGIASTTAQHASVLGQVQSYLYLWTGISAVVSVVCTFCLPKLYQLHISAEEVQDGALEDVLRSEKPAPEAEKDKPALGALFRKPEIYMLMCFYFFGTAQGMAFGASLKTIVKTYDTPDSSTDTDLMLSLYITMELIGRLIGGIASDMLAPFMSRLTTMCFFISFLIFGQIGLYFLESIFLLPLVLFIGFSYASTYAALPAYVRNTFDVKYFGIITAIGYSCMIPGNIFFTYLITSCFEAHKQPGKEMCYGHECNKIWTLSGGVIALIPIIFAMIINFCVDSRKNEATLEERKSLLAVPSGTNSKYVRRSSVQSGLDIPSYHPNVALQEDMAEQHSALLISVDVAAFLSRR